MTEEIKKELDELTEQEKEKLTEYLNAVKLLSFLCNP